MRDSATLGLSHVIYSNIFIINIQNVNVFILYIR